MDGSEAPRTDQQQLLYNVRLNVYDPGDHNSRQLNHL